MNPSLNIPQARFLTMPHKFRAYVAGYGCVDANTRIVTEYGLLRIKDIDRPMRVLSWCEKSNQFVLSLSGGAFPKGKANLYRILTGQGEFVASGHHHVLCDHDNYRRVDTLCVGDKVLSSSQFQHHSMQELSLLLSLLDVKHYQQIHVDSMGSYATSARQYGQQLLSGQDSDQEHSPLQGDALISSQLSERVDVLQVLSLLHNHLNQLSDHIYKSDLIHLFAPLELVVASRIGEQHLEPSCEGSQLIQQSQVMTLCRRLTLLFSQRLDLEVCSEICDVLCSIQSDLLACECAVSKLLLILKSVVRLAHRYNIDILSSECRSFNSSLIKSVDVLSITQTEERVYYDMQVLDTNNYVTEDGAIHHNSGKTWAGSAGICKHFWEFPKVNAGYFAPSYPQIRDIFYPTIEEVAHDWGMRVEIREGNKEVHFYNGKTYRGTTICRSMDNPSSIVGFKIGHALADEIDTINKVKATQVWRRMIARMRYNLSGLRNGIDVTTTPEGFGFAYEQFVKQLRDKPEMQDFYGIIHASTYDNEKNLPADYIPSLVQSYPENLIKAYLNGQFVNLNSGTVYSEFDRKLNHSDRMLEDNDVLHIGMDFNVLNMACVIYVLDDGKITAVDEITDGRDTPTVARLIKERYPNRTIRIYPDASGQNKSSKNASESDLLILKQHGFSLMVDSSNPAVKDRINATNAMLCNSQGERRMFVNTNRCVKFTEGLEQQAYNNHGEPDKTSGVDHVNDAGTYPIVKLFPIRRPKSKIQTAFSIY